MRRSWTAALVAAALVVPALSACGEDGDVAAATAPATTPTAGTPAPAGDTGGAAGIMLAGSGLSVAEALARPAGDPDVPIVVRAYALVAADGSAQLCDALAESSPPQCAGERMGLTGLPDGFLTGLRSAAGVHWSDAPVQLIGRVRGDVFENDAQALVAG